MSVLTLCRTCVYVYIGQLSSFRVPTLWFIDLTVTICHIQYTFLSVWYKNGHWRLLGMQSSYNTDRASLTLFHSCLNIHHIYSTINSRNLSKHNVISSLILSCARVSTSILCENASNGPRAILQTETIVVVRINLLVLRIPPFYSWFRKACCVALKWSIVALCKPSDGRCRSTNDPGFICKTYQSLGIPYTRGKCSAQFNLYLL